MPEPTSILPTALAGSIPSAVLIAVNVITVLVAVLITRCCCNSVSRKISTSKDEVIYEQAEGPKTSESIVMTDNPAYGPVK